MSSLPVTSFPTKQEETMTTIPMTPAPDAIMTDSRSMVNHEESASCSTAPSPMDHVGSWTCRARDHMQVGQLREAMSCLKMCVNAFSSELSAGEDASRWSSPSSIMRRKGYWKIEGLARMPATPQDLPILPVLFDAQAVLQDCLASNMDRPVLLNLMGAVVIYNLALSMHALMLDAPAEESDRAAKTMERVSLLYKRAHSFLSQVRAHPGACAHFVYDLLRVCVVDNWAAAALPSQPPTCTTTALEHELLVAVCALDATPFGDLADLLHQVFQYAAGRKMMGSFPICGAAAA